MSFIIEDFGKLNGTEQVKRITLSSDAFECSFITYGACIQSIKVPSKDGLIDIALGFDTLEGYVQQDKYMGATVGRFANRISGAAFSLNGKEYLLAPNEGRNTLHGGLFGFDKKNWAIEDADVNSVTFFYISPDGEEGFPGSLSVRVRYTVDGNRLTVSYSADSDQDTVVNIINHSYLNLSSGGTVCDHFVRIDSDLYLPTDKESIPIAAAPVAGTPMDLRQVTILSERLDSSFDQIKKARGYDHCFILNPSDFSASKITCYSDASGVIMKLFTDAPAVQFYTGNFLDGCPAGKGGAVYSDRSGLCFETGSCPDSPNRPEFPSALLKAGERFTQSTVFEFGLLPDTGK